jgi:hypothetical protein
MNSITKETEVMHVTNLDIYESIGSRDTLNFAITPTRFTHAAHAIRVSMPNISDIKRQVGIYLFLKNKSDGQFISLPTETSLITFFFVKEIHVVSCMLAAPEKIK